MRHLKGILLGFGLVLICASGLTACNTTHNADAQASNVTNPAPQHQRTHQHKQTTTQTTSTTTQTGLAPSAGVVNDQVISDQSMQPTQQPPQSNTSEPNKS